MQQEQATVNYMLLDSASACIVPGSADNADNFVHEWHDPTSTSYVPPDRWCISWKDLIVFETEVRELWELGGIPQSEKFHDDAYDDYKVGPSIHQVNKFYIKPTTKNAGGMSWSLMRNPEGLQCTVFATHCWQEGAFELIDAIKSCWPMRDIGENLWVCFAANPQNGDIARIVGTANNAPLRDSPFAVALVSARRMLVIPNQQVSIYGRLWCVFEAYFAFQQVQKGNLALELPSGIQTKEVLQRICLAFACSVVAVFIVWWCTDFIPDSNFLGPSLWMLIGIFLSHTGATCFSWVRRDYREYHSYINICIFIVAAGMGHHAFAEPNASAHFGHAEYRNHRYAGGEGHAWWVLFTSFYLLLLDDLVFHLLKVRFRESGKLLSFETVNEATCTSEADERRIKNEIQGTEGDVDQFIRCFKVVGRFNRAVRTNLELGMSTTGIMRSTPHRRCFKTCVICISWGFWWVTDLIGQGRSVEAYVSLVSAMLIFSAIVFLGGDASIWPVELFYWFGIFYLGLSTIFCWSDEAVEQHRLSASSRRFRFWCFLSALCIGVLLRVGMWKCIKDACGMNKDGWKHTFTYETASDELSGLTNEMTSDGASEPAPVEE